jgi:hypothetical protein
LFFRTQHFLAVPFRRDIPNWFLEQLPERLSCRGRIALHQLLEASDPVMELLPKLARIPCGRRFAQTLPRLSRLPVPIELLGLGRGRQVASSGLTPLAVVEEFDPFGDVRNGLLPGHTVFDGLTQSSMSP